MTDTTNKTCKKRKIGKNEQYFNMLFFILRRRDNLVTTDQVTHFNNTELRLLGEIHSSSCAGERLISTQLAKRLGITRSAVSQIVNRLEKEGVVKRVPDAVDRKIAYIEMEDKAVAGYSEDLKKCFDFIGRVVKEFGEENFNTMYELLISFMDKLEKERKKSELDKAND